MRKPFDVTKPVETLFDQIEDAVEYAHAGNALYNTTQIIVGHTFYSLIQVYTQMRVDTGES